MTFSDNLFSRAEAAIAGGVNSPVRAFKGVGGTPRFIKRGQGATLIDADNQSYIDYVGSWGPLILGHAHPTVISKVIAALQNGLTFGAPTEIEVLLAEKVKAYMPNLECVRFVSTGTEAAMSAIRLSRGYTKRQKIIKFAGCYHGHADSLLVAQGSGGLTFGVPCSAGVTENTAKDTLIADFNDLNQVEALFKQYPDDIAAVIVEPIAANMNLILPLPHFLPGLRALCDKYESLLIFDEVITGFRVGLGGAQAYYHVKPDLTILGKIVGGGLPAALFGGRKKIMSQLAPLGPVYQAGTLSGNPVAMTAGLATLELLAKPGLYESLKINTQILIQGLNSLAEEYAIPFHALHIESMFGLFFTQQKILSREQDVKQCDMALFKLFFHGMLKQGIYLAPSAFEVGFVSTAHGQEEITKTLNAAKKAFESLANDSHTVIQSHDLLAG